MTPDRAGGGGEDFRVGQGGERFTTAIVVYCSRCDYFLKNWQQHVDALRAEIARRDAVIDAARELLAIVPHTHDGMAGAVCNFRHDLINKEHHLRDALSALERQVGE